MWIHVATIVVYAGFYLVIVFLTLGIACALFYLAELIEEHISLTKRLLSYLIRAELVLHAILLVDRLPLLCLVVSAGAQVSHHALLKRFPYNSITAPSSLASTGLTLAASFLWIHHFWTRQYTGEYMVAFCLVTTWLTPAALLLGVTGEQAVLPGAGGYPYSSPGPAQHGGLPGPPRKASRRGLALRLFDILRRKRDEAVPGLVSHLPGVAKEKM